MIDDCSFVASAASLSSSASSLTRICEADPPDLALPDGDTGSNGDSPPESSSDKSGEAPEAMFSRGAVEGCEGFVGGYTWLGGMVSKV